MTTYREICEKYVKFAGLNMTGLEFWNASPTGELNHVDEAAEILREYGLI